MCYVQGLCKLMVALFNYLLLTNFFWMLVEGLYLHTVIVWTFSIDHLRLRHYAALGWGQWSTVVIFIFIFPSPLSFFLLTFFFFLAFSALTLLVGWAAGRASCL